MMPTNAVQIQLLMNRQQRQQRAKTRRWQSGKNGNGVDEAFVKNPEDDIDDQNCRDQQ